MLTRRAATQSVVCMVTALALGGAGMPPAPTVIKIGFNLSLTGADADSAARIKNGAMMAFDEANARQDFPGYRLDVLVLDDGTATAGQYDPAQAATNARKLVADKAVIAMIGPMMSGAGKAMAPILSQAGLATITPSSTNPDITDSKYAVQYRPGGKPIYFRTVTTDAYQGPNLANFFAETLQVKSVFVLDDSGAYGVGIADGFQSQAEKKGVKVLGRERLDPKAADYSATLTKIKSLSADALYYGGLSEAGVKLAKQAFGIVPKTIKGAGDGMYAREMLTEVGFPAAEGWYVTIASPHLVGDKAVDAWVRLYRASYNLTPDDYAITAYDAGLVVVAAIKALIAAKKPVTRATMRDAIQASKVKTLQGEVAFDANGDLKNHTISVFQVRKDVNHARDDMGHQYHYVAAAPQS